jgi:hypothetical protein
MTNLIKKHETLKSAQNSINNGSNLYEILNLVFEAGEIEGKKEQQSLLKKLRIEQKTKELV